MTVTGSASAATSGPSGAAASGGGVTFVPASGAVVGLNYYDGRFLRADDLNLERRSQRGYVELSNRSGSSGPVRGFDLSGLGTGRLHLSAGLATAPRGQVLHLPEDVQASVTDLLPGGSGSGSGMGSGMGNGTGTAAATGFEPCSTASTPGGGGTVTVAGTALYLVCLTSASSLQGTAEVVGRLCEGCVTATDRPYLVDGVTLLLRPLTLDTQPFTLPGTTTPDIHLRSQVASAFFAVERTAAGAMSAQALASTLWSVGAVSQAGDDAVVLGVLGWNGNQITLLDPWTARRESMQSPPSVYWAGRLEQRPLPVFLAQVLQFQDQLSAAPAAPGGSRQELVDRGFVELPSAGYLPVTPETSDLRDRLSAQFGPGVQLWLSAVRRDQVPHEFERAQHMDRISLLRGLHDEAHREQVDILVPDGLITAAQGGLGFAVDFALGQDVGAALDVARDNPRGTARGQGAGRVEPGPGFNARAALAVALPRAADALARLLRPADDEGSGAAAFLADTRTSPAVDTPAPGLLRSLADRVQAASAAPRVRAAGSLAAVPVGTFRVAAVAASLTVDDDPFELADGKATRFQFEGSAYQPGTRPIAANLQAWGTLTRKFSSGGQVTVSATGGFALSGSGLGSPDRGGTFEDRILLLTRSAQDGETVTVRDNASSLVVDLHWKGDPVHAEASLRRRKAGQQAGGEGDPPPIAALTAVQDAGIGRAGNTYHDSAASALALLAAAHTDPEYAEREYQRLFPPDDRSAATVQARRDWVLFRRRRREDREGDPVTPVALDSVTVQVLRVEGIEEAKRVVDVLLGSAAGDWPSGWKATDVVYLGGTTTMLTPAASWQQRYRACDGADAVAFAGYAPASGSLGALVGTGRLRALLGALPPGVTPDPGLPTVPVVPPAGLQPAPGTDGSAFLVSYLPGPVPVPTLAVRALLVSVQNGAAVAAVGKPEPALTTDVDPFAALAEGGIGTLDTAKVATQLRTFLKTNGIRMADVRTVLWTHSSVSTSDAQQWQDLAQTVETAVTGMSEVRQVTPGARFGLDFTRTDTDLVAQLFLLVSPFSPIN
jgi:hypothetical protein